MMSRAPADQAVSARIAGWLRRLAWSVVRRVYRTVRVLPFGYLAVALGQAVRHRQERAQARRWSLRAVREDAAFNRRRAAEVAAAMRQGDPLPKRRFRTATFHYFPKTRPARLPRLATLQPRVVTLHRELDELNGYLEAIVIAEADSPSPWVSGPTLRVGCAGCRSGSNKPRRLSANRQAMSRKEVTTKSTGTSTRPDQQRARMRSSRAAGMAKIRLPAHTSVPTIGRRKDSVLGLDQVRFAKSVEVDGQQIGQLRQAGEQTEYQHQINRQAEQGEP